MNDDYMDIPETTLANLSESEEAAFATLYPENDGPDDVRPYDQDENADMFRTAVVGILDAMFLFDAGIAQWEGE